MAAVAADTAAADMAAPIAETTADARTSSDKSASGRISDALAGGVQSPRHRLSVTR
jgi:hypothetical protein